MTPRSGPEGLRPEFQQRLTVRYTQSVDPLAIIHEYKRANSREFNQHVSRILNAFERTNHDGTPMREKVVIFDWGGLSGDGTSLGMLAFRKYIDMQLDEKSIPRPSWVYENFISAVKIGRNLGWVRSPQGVITLDEYQAIARIRAEVADLIIGYLPGEPNQGRTLAYARDNVIETEMYDQGIYTGTPRGLVTLRRLIANYRFVFKTSINAPESVNQEAMTDREIVPTLSDREVPIYLASRGIVDTRSSKQIKKSFLECGNRLTLLQQNKDVVENAVKYIRRHSDSQVFEGMTGLIGRCRHILQGEPIERSARWAEFIQDPRNVIDWDRFMNAYLKTWQQLVFADDSDDIYWGVVLTPGQLPQETRRYEDREWFEQNAATTLLVQQADKTGNDILVSRLRGLMLISKRKKYHFNPLSYIQNP